MPIKVLKQTMINRLREADREAQKPRPLKHVFVEIEGNRIEAWGYCTPDAPMSRGQYRFPNVIGLPDEEKLVRIQHWLATDTNAPDITLVDWI